MTDYTLGAAQVAQYNEDGFLLLPDFFPRQDMDQMLAIARAEELRVARRRPNVPCALHERRAVEARLALALAHTSTHTHTHTHTHASLMLWVANGTIGVCGLVT